MLILRAYIASLRSTCNRLQVGAVIVRAGRTISDGYAGAPSGLPHCSKEICNADNPCTRTVHAEAGAIAYAAREGIATGGAELYCTHAPCKPCSDLILNAGIKKVVYVEAYRKTEGIEQLKAGGVTVEQYLLREELRLSVMRLMAIGREPVSVGQGVGQGNDNFRRTGHGG